MRQAEAGRAEADGLRAKLQAALAEREGLAEERAQGLEAAAERTARAALEERMQGRVLELEMALGAACKVSKQAGGALAALAGQIERQGREVWHQYFFLVLFYIDYSSIFSVLNGIFDSNESSFSRYCADAKRVIY